MKVKGHKMSLNTCNRQKMTILMIVHTLNATSIEHFHISSLKMQKHKGTKQIYANLQIDGTDNYLCTQENTASDADLIPAPAYKQVYNDTNLELLQPMDINLSEYNESKFKHSAPIPFH